MTDAGFDRLLDRTQAMHRSEAALSTFVAMPDRVERQPVETRWTRAAEPLLKDPRYASAPYRAVSDAVGAVAHIAQWRETYAGTGIGSDFMDRFACFCLIGPGGPFKSAELQGYFVYMPPYLHYPWHQHPAEEMYFVVAGRGRLHRYGMQSEDMGPGDTVFHASNQHHALDTDASGLLAYVVWRNEFDTPPTLSKAEDVA